MITIEASGSFKNTEAFLEEMSKRQMFKTLDRFGKVGVDALASATPIDSGVTAASWDYEIDLKKGRVAINWTNSHVVSGTPIAIILQYGHGTGTGGYVAGQDYINPATKPVFDKIAEDVWKAVTSA